MDAILAFVSGKDVFVSLPTGYGKSFLLSIPSTAFRCPPKPQGSYFNSCSCNSIGSNYERSSGGADLWNVNFQVFLINAHQKSVTSCIPWRHGPYTRLSRPLPLFLQRGLGTRLHSTVSYPCAQRSHISLTPIRTIHNAHFQVNVCTSGRQRVN